MEARPADATLAPPINGTPRHSVAPQTFEVGSWVWMPCVTNGFRRSTIVSHDGVSDSFLVDKRDETDPAAGGQERVRRSDIRPFFDSGLENTCEDNTSLVHLDEANILNNIYRRFLQNHIYTYTANVLLAVNPYKQLPHLYTEEKMLEYKQIHNIGMKQPHPYAIADKAYRDCMRSWNNQALIISGESGAGKTETAKITMRYLTSVSRTDAARGIVIQDKIVNANPILESFGNAQTVRNRNSSRFGKYNEMQFNRVGSLIGAGIQTYLLENSRVVHHGEGEKNFHVFYQLLCGMSDEQLEDLQLDRTSKYQLLYTEKAKLFTENSPDFQRASEEFADLREALNVVGVQPEVQQETFEVVAALVHLGEVKFGNLPGVDMEGNQLLPAQPNDLPSRAQSAPAIISQTALVEPLMLDDMSAAAELLGISEARFLQVLKWREVHAARGSQNESHIRVPRTQAQAYQTLHSIIKIVYKRLFEQIVHRINVSSSGQTGNNRGSLGEDGTQHADHRKIGTLDIYGFERLAVNSFEQLCINLANERLQQFFVEQVLDAEQKMYANEKIHIHNFDLPDSKPVVASIKNIMAILDDHSKRSIKNLVAKGEDADQKFCENVHRDCIRAPQDRRSTEGPLAPLKLKASRSGTNLGLHDGFVVRHYAGEVSYSTRGWIEKNNDALVPEVESLLRSSRKALVSSLAAPEAAIETGERFNSVSHKYLSNLADLLETLEQSKLHYIRCFNPNERRCPATFEKKYVLDQVIQCGTVELVNIMHEGFPHRCKLTEIREHFTKLLPKDFERYKDRDFVEAIMIAFEMPAAEWTVGTSRLFLKAGQLRVLENLLDSGAQATQDMIRKIVRQFARKKLRAAKNAIRFALWLPKYAKEKRRAKLAGMLRKSVFVFVRLHRWLRKARRSLYGGTPPRDISLLQWRMLKENLIYPMERKDTLQTPHPQQAQLFVVLNGVDREDKYGAKVQTQASSVQWSRGAADGPSESVLYFYDGFLRTADFKHAGFYPVAEPQAGNQLCVDVGATDLLVQTRLECSNRVSHICQSRSRSKVFATCSEVDNSILIWSWTGISNTRTPAIMVHSEMARINKDILYGMCFLSDAPKSIAEQGGHVLLTLTGDPTCHWMTIRIMTMIPGNCKIEFQLRIGELPLCEHGSLLEAAKNGQLIFQISHSEQILVLAGRRVAHFYQIRTEPKFEVCKVQDMASEYGHDFSISSCLCMPPPSGTINRAIDWIVLGEGDGGMCGFLWQMNEVTKTVQLGKPSGRFSSKQPKHTHNVPVGLLMSTYGVHDNGAMKAVRIQDAFFSLGNDGLLLRWNLHKSGWSSQEENFHRRTRPSARDPAQRQVLAAHSSRLVPSLLYLVGQDTKIQCVESSSPVKHCNATDAGGPISHVATPQRGQRAM